MMLEQSLQKYFGYSSFRPGQKETIESLMAGNDVLAMLPTGTGKSICYQLPALLADGVTLIISPLLSLMEDQVQQLKSEGMRDVVALNSFLNREKRQEVLANLHKYKLIYVSPEIVQNEFVLEKISALRIDYFIVDEAHCISQWGFDFRPDYLRLNKVRKRLGSPPCLAITATATEAVQAHICHELELKNVKKHIYSVDRPEISYHVVSCDHEIDKINTLQHYVERLPSPGLVYFSSRMLAEITAIQLQQKMSKRIAYYHGGLTTEERLLIQQQFMNDELDVICCTSAFGMGINKKDIRFVIHYHYPTEIESYVQEVGRAARDGKQSTAIVLHMEGDDRFVHRLILAERRSRQEWFTQLQCLQIGEDWDEAKKNFDHFDEVSLRMLHYQLEHLGMIVNNKIQQLPTEYTVDYLIEQQEYQYYLKRRKLASMESWLRSEHCRRKQILDYFSEKMNIMDRSNCCDRCEAIIPDRVIETKQFELEDWEQTLAKLCAVKRG